MMGNLASIQHISLTNNKEVKSASSSFYASLVVLGFIGIKKTTTLNCNEK